MVQQVLRVLQDHKDPLVPLDLTETLELRVSQDLQGRMDPLE